MMCYAQTTTGRLHMTDDMEKVRRARAKARRKLFPDAPKKVKCRRCKKLYLNPVIQHGAVSQWCSDCMDEVIAEYRAENKRKKRRKRKR